MKKLLTIDASVFVSVFNDHEVQHEVSKNFLEEVTGGRYEIFVPIVTLFEVLQSFFRITGDSKAKADVLEKFIDWNIEGNLTILPIEAEFLAYFSAHHEKFDLKTADSMIALTALKENSTLITWDEKLLKQSSKFVKSQTPKQFVANL